jgi:hypothetical protein
MGKSNLKTVELSTGKKYITYDVNLSDPYDPYIVPQDHFSESEIAEILCQTVEGDPDVILEGNLEWKPLTPYTPELFAKWPAQKRELAREVAGFFAGEGSVAFCASKSRRSPTGIECSIIVGFSNQDRGSLDTSQDVMTDGGKNKCGHITGIEDLEKTRRTDFVYQINGRRQLEAYVIPVLLYFLTMSKVKREQLLIAQEGLVRFKNGVKSVQDIKDFLAMRKRLEAHRTPRTKNTDDVVLSHFKPTK